MQEALTSRRPGTNVTGLSAAGTEIFPKRVQLLKELVPKAARLGVLFNMANPALPPQWKEVEKAARVLSLEPQLLDVRKVEDLEPAFDAAIKQRADGSSWGSTPSPRRTSTSSWTWPPG